MRVFIVRHGESETNKKGHWTGWYNAPLTQKGIDDATGAGEILREYSFDKVYTSDLDRAILTMKTALGDCDYEATHLLREIDVGILRDTSISRISAEKIEYLRRNGFSEYQGETREDLQKRVAGFKEKIQNLDCENIAVFTHAGWLVGFLEHTLGGNIIRSNVMCRNCCIGVFEYTKGRWLLHSWINKL